MEQMNQRITFAAFAAGIAIGVLAVLFVHRGNSPVSPEKSVTAVAPLPQTHAEQAQARETGDVYIDPAMVQNLGVRTVAVAPRVIAESIRTTGYVDYDQEHVVNINARISGWIEKLHVAYVGEQVKKGQRVLEIYSPELVLTEEDFLRSRRLAGLSKGASPAQSDGRQLMAAARDRMHLMGIPDSEIRRLEQSGQISETVPLASAATGVVTQIKAVEGAHVKAGDDLYTVADLSRVWVYADIYEREVANVKVRQKAAVTSDALAGKTFQGEVAYIYPNVNEQTRTVRVRLEFPNTEGLLRPGMYVKTTLMDESPEKRLAVPTEAVLNSGVRHLVIVDKGQGHFEPREIQIGSESSGHYPVLSGLREGEQVVTSAQFLIDSESNLHEALDAMALKPQAGAAATQGQER
jgi:Cu(I)/Ag(I) efflux system membrane fusion protein/cobalt-zinc-cadmium efflux system membrane fusion protein